MLTKPTALRSLRIASRKWEPVEYYFQIENYLPWSQPFRHLPQRSKQHSKRHDKQEKLNSERRHDAPQLQRAAHGGPSVHDKGLKHKYKVPGSVPSR
jgi:hypothetical protein